MKRIARLTFVAALLLAAVPARAGEVKIAFSGGLVTIVATDASPRQILAEWAKLGQVRITNLERLAGGPVTIQLTNVPEGQALETLLRGTAGFVAAPRQAAADVAVSRYDRILLMPGSAPAVSTAPATAAQGAIGRARTAPQPAQAIELPDDDDSEDPPRPVSMPIGGQRGGQRFPGGVSTPGQVVPGQVTMPTPGQAPGYFSPYQVTPRGGLGIGTTQQPGMQPQPSAQGPGTPIRSFQSPQLPPNSTSSSVPGVTTPPMTIQTMPYSSAGPLQMMPQADDGNAGQFAPGAGQGAARPGDTTAPARPQSRNPNGVPETIRPSVTDPGANPYSLPNTGRMPLMSAPTPATTPGGTTPGATTPGATTTPRPIKQPGTKG